MNCLADGDGCQAELLLQCPLAGQPAGDLPGGDPGSQDGRELDRSAAVPDGSDVTADTKDGVITLTGRVRTWAEHDAVVGAALMARGVVDIRDGLEVTG